VNEVKRQAIIELQKALTTTHYKNMGCHSGGNDLKVSQESRKSIVSNTESEYSAQNGFPTSVKFDSSSLFYPPLQNNVRMKNTRRHGQYEGSRDGLIT